MPKRKISNEEKNSIERTVMSMVRSALSEERTLLAYIRTYLAVLGIVYIGLRFYFVDTLWSVPLAFGLSLFFGVLIVIETVKIKKLRVRRMKLQKKHQLI